MDTATSPTPRARATWLLGAPGPQRVRAAQTLLAAVTFTVFAFVQEFEVRQGFVDPFLSNLLSAANVGVALAFFLAIRTGLNLRWRADPSLTFAQCLFGVASTAAAYAITGPARGAVMGILMLVLVFAMFALPPARIRALALAAFGFLLAAMGWGVIAEPDRYPLAVEIVHLAFAVVIISSIAVLSLRMGALRAKLHRQRAELLRALEQNRRLAMLDDLTGLVNRRHMAQTLQSEHERTGRGGTPFSVALIDIDLFKRINDLHGHAAGDTVLRGFAQVALDGLRACDPVARWGGEEFLVLLPQTDAAHAAIAVERLRIAFSAHAWGEIDPQLHVTFSAGIATLAPGETVEALVERADQCMYAAKTSGRDRVVIEAAPACPAIACPAGDDAGAEVPAHGRVPVAA